MNRRINMKDIERVSSSSSATIPVGTPSNKGFIVHDHDELRASVVYYDNTHYLVNQGVVNRYRGRLKYLSEVKLIRAKYIDYNQEFLLIIRNPWDGNSPASRDSLLDAVRCAREGNSITLKFLNTEEGYSFNSKQLKNEPDWSSRSMNDLIESAFSDEHYVFDASHPLLKNILHGNDGDHQDDSDLAF